MREFIENEQRKIESIRHDLIINLETAQDTINKLLEDLKQESSGTDGLVFGVVLPAIHSAVRNETELQTRLELIRKASILK